jgi:2-polyprenyl-6-methoxyphenol hydroxylase-like FAD-dependent oxidoreductase
MLAPGFATRVRAARPVEPFRCSADLIDVVRRAYGPGWALAGDAGFCQDPIRARGIMDAFLDVERLVEAIDAGLSGRQSLDLALATCEEWRNEVAFPSLEATCQATRLLPDLPAEHLLRAALRESPELANLYVGISVGTVTPEAFCARAPSGVRKLFEALWRCMG